MVISPEREVAEAALQRLAAPAAFDTESFMGGRAQLLGIQLDEDCPVLNTPLRQLNELFSTLRAIVVGIRREDRLFAPEPGDQLYADDQIYVFTHVEDVNRTLEIFGKKTKKQERIVIVGGGNVGLAVARALEARTDRVRAKIIEKDRATRRTRRRRAGTHHRAARRRDGHRHPDGSRDRPRRCGPCRDR